MTTARLFSCLHCGKQFTVSSKTMPLWFTFNGDNGWLLNWRGYCPLINCCNISQASQGTYGWGGGELGALGQAGETRGRWNSRGSFSLAIRRQACSCWLQKGRCFGFSDLTFGTKGNEVPRRRMAYKNQLSRKLTLCALKVNVFARR